MMLILLGLMVGTVAAAQPARAEVRTVSAVDLGRYVGRWYELARLPNRFEASCASDVTAEYARAEDGRLRVTNRCRRQDGTLDEAVGEARVVDTETRAKLKVRFAPAWLGWLPFVWGDYWILGLAEDYRYAVVGSPDREYLWVLARAPELSQADWDEALDIARRNGFDLAPLIRTTQTR